MLQRLTDFARANGLELSQQSAKKLLSYARRVLDKKMQLNLTGADTLEELVNRHLCDGLVGAAQILRLAAADNLHHFTVLDAGSGAGFIGLTIAAALPQAQVTLVESLEKRCAFLNWVVLSESFSNVQVKNIRLGQGNIEPVDFLIERAMGQLPDIASICLDAVRPSGVWLAYQGAVPQTERLNPEQYGGKWEETKAYQLPQDDALKQLVLGRKAV